MGKMSPKAPSLPPPPTPIPGEEISRRGQSQEAGGRAYCTRPPRPWRHDQHFRQEPKARLRHNVQRFSATNT